jgi:tetratricopeptide (TPR) repeat protein
LLSVRIAPGLRRRYDGAMSPSDDSHDDKPAAGTPFGPLVSALRARPQPRKPRRHGETADAEAASRQPPPIDEQLDRAETCSRSGRIDEAIAICNALRPSLVANGDPQSLGWCDFVLALSHLNAGRAKEAVIAGYRAVAKLAPGTRLMRSLTMLASAVARTGDAAGALELLERAKQQLPLVHSPRDRCLFWVNCGSTFHALGDMERAVEHSVQAEALLPEFEDPYLHGATKMNLLLHRLILAVARCHGSETPELTALFAEFSSQVERLVAAGQHYPVAKGCEDIADAYIAIGQHEKAREALQIGVKSADAAKAGPDRGILELRLGRIERLAGQYRRASAHIGLALELLAESALLKELAEAHLENSLLNEERQHWRAALDSYRQSAQIRERLLIAQSDARAHALTVRLELVRGTDA